MLADHHFGEHSRQHTPVKKLIAISLAEIHRGAGIQKNLATHVGVVLELFDVEFVTSGPDFPIDIPQVVTLRVRSVGRKLSAVAEKWAAMKAVQKTFHDGAGQQRQIVDGSQSARIDVERG